MCYRPIVYVYVRYQEGYFYVNNEVIFTEHPKTTVLAFGFQVIPTSLTEGNQ
jgi:hypothetical protein